MDPEIIILSEVNQTEKDKNHMISLAELKKKDTNEYIYQAEIDSHTQKTKTN